jgi:ACR3 family arsenite efflux pump ArsB
LLTLILIFSFQGEVILANPLHILLIAVPLIIQTVLIFFWPTEHVIDCNVDTTLRHRLE